MFGTQEPRNSIGYDVKNPTPSVATYIIATPTIDGMSTAGERPALIRNDARKQTPGVATSTETPYLVYELRNAIGHDVEKPTLSVTKTDADFEM
jgi:hypothetical protein